MRDQILILLWGGGLRAHAVGLCFVKKKSIVSASTAQDFAERMGMSWYSFYLNIFVYIDILNFY